MASVIDKNRRTGIVQFGGSNRSDRGGVSIKTATEGGQNALDLASVASQGSVLALEGVAANKEVFTWYFFVTSAGVLRRSQAFPTNTETDGTAV